MKRLFLGLIILAAGTAAFAALRHSTNELGKRSVATRQLFTAQTQFLAEARVQFASLEDRVRDLSLSLVALGGIADPPASDLLLSCIGSNRVSAAQSEELLSELGFNWGTTGDYLVVSKDTLTGISLMPLQGAKLSQVVCDVLAITPDERAGVDALAQNLTEAYRAWASDHLQREQPAGDVIGKYSLPADVSFSGSLSNQLTQGVMTLLGEERGSYFLYYSQFWLLRMGIYGGGAKSLTVFRQQAGDQSRLFFRVQSPSGMLTSPLSPHNLLPEAFLPLFPNGWADLAQREGFELPNEFKTPPQ